MKPSTVKSPLSCSRPIAPGDLPPSIHPVSSVSRPFSVPGPYEGQLLENSGGVRDELRASKKQNGVATLTPVHRSGTSRSSRGSSRRGSYQTLPQRLRERGCRRHLVGVTLPEKGLRVSPPSGALIWPSKRPLTHVRGPPEFRNKSAGVFVDGLRGPAELAENLHVGQSGHLREQSGFPSQFLSL